MNIEQRRILQYLLQIRFRLMASGLLKTIEIHYENSTGLFALVHPIRSLLAACPYLVVCAAADLAVVASVQDHWVFNRNDF
jgi:hypothetical protein